MAEMFLRLQGPEGDIVGESTDRDAVKQIEVTGWDWELKSDADFHLSAQESAKLMKPEKINIHKGVDRASVTLVQFCTLGTLIKKATLRCRKNAGEQKFEYLVVELTDVKVANVAWAQEEHIVKESLALEFVTVKADYRKQDNNAGEAADGKVHFGWDFEHNVAT